MSGYTLAEIAASTGLSPRTIRYYIAQGLVPSPGRAGSTTRYPASTLARLGLIARLRDANLSLAEIRTQLAGLDDAEVAALLAEPSRPRATEPGVAYVRGILGQDPSVDRRDLGHLELAEHGASRSWPSGELRTQKRALAESPRVLFAAGKPSARSSFGDRSLWEHIGITTDIELHVRRPLSQRDNRMVGQLMALVQRLVEGSAT